MTNITYDFAVGQTVWILFEGAIIECLVERVVLEVDLNSSGEPVEIKTYHINLKNADNDIVLRTQGEVFETEYNAILYAGDPSETFTPLTTHTIPYIFAINDIVWTPIAQSPVFGDIAQITITIQPDDDNIVQETVLYHILPDSEVYDESYSTIIKPEAEVFDTYDEVLYYIAVTILELTPTPTPTVTPTPSG